MPGIDDYKHLNFLKRWSIVKTSKSKLFHSRKFNEKWLTQKHTGKKNDWSGSWHEISGLPVFRPRKLQSFQLSKSWLNLSQNEKVDISWGDVQSEFVVGAFF